MQNNLRRIGTALLCALWIIGLAVSGFAQKASKQPTKKPTTTAETQPAPLAQPAPTAVATNAVVTVSAPTVTNGSSKPYLDTLYSTEESGTNTLDPANPFNPFWDTLKIILITAVFAVIAYFIVKLIVSRSGVPTVSDDEAAEIILNKSLGMGIYLTVVKIGTQYYLLSVGNDGAKLVDKIEDKETIDALELNKGKMKPKENKFFDLLSLFPAAKKVDKVDFLKQQKDKLRKL